MTTIADIDPNTQHAARTFIAKVSAQYAVADAILFGSRARRNSRMDSDLDIAVVLRGSRGRFVDTKLALADIAYDVLLETGILIQALPLWEDELKQPERYTNPDLLRNISRDGIRL
ncbi:MAG: DNA polymerase III subunit beta [Betaproteobacteria bacterium RBG_16_58_11]|nr:MAG: DNA polymerase III subunit beta [Betaproteobacteria bacterium RBG_16_58_11]OFZ97176.1 MAG: DNA polymerase III subunit beta [Betaproteobacteria bacterium RBG_19FT_COMBO_58_11]